VVCPRISQNGFSIVESNGRDQLEWTATHVCIEEQMKTLLLLRHAKSSWKDNAMKDFDRPLNHRGLKAAPTIGRLMRKRKLQPDLVLSSPAERARQTTQLVLDSAGFKSELRYDERIYEASSVRLFEVVSQIEDEANVALLVGHNPGMEELLEALTGEAHSLSTAALACIKLDLERWSKLRAGENELAWLVKPKELKSSKLD
jgi:phosphohistidine phosphatase